MVLEAIAGHDSRDASSCMRTFKFAAKKAAARRMRIGYLVEDYAKNDAADVQKCFEEVLTVFRKMGHEVRETKFADYPYSLCADTIMGAEGASSFESLLRSPRLKLLKDVRQESGLLAGWATPAVDYLRAMR